MSKHRQISIVSYDPRWPEAFRAEASLIAAIFAEELLAVHHIGGTSIPGMSAKPIIDIMPIVRNIGKAEAFNEAMTRVGYTPMGEYGIAGRRFFLKGGDDARTHHVHAYEPDNPEVRWHLNFRDYLAAHASDALECAKLKIRLAAEHRYDIDAYTKGKSAFVKNVLAKAEAWRDEHGT